MQKEKLGDGSGYQFSSSESQMILMKDLGLTQQTAFKIGCQTRLQKGYDEN